MRKQSSALLKWIVFSLLSFCLFLSCVSTVYLFLKLWYIIQLFNMLGNSFVKKRFLDWFWQFVKVYPKTVCKLWTWETLSHTSYFWQIWTNKMFDIYFVLTYLDIKENCFYFTDQPTQTFLTVGIKLELSDVSKCNFYLYFLT